MFPQQPQIFNLNAITVFKEDKFQKGIYLTSINSTQDRFILINFQSAIQIKDDIVR